MLRGFAAHYVLVGPGSVFRYGGVVVDEDGVVRQVFSLGDAKAEPANTSFFDGWIVPFAVDLSGVPAAGLEKQLQAHAATLGAVITVGLKTKLYNYRADASGCISVLPINL